MQQILQFLNAPFPPDSSYRATVIRAACVGLFVSVFLTLFQPFGLHTIEGPHRLWLIASFGLPCVPIIVAQGGLFVWISRRWDFEARWKVGHQIVVTLLIPLLIGVSNYFHGKLLFGWPFIVSNLIQMVLHTIAVGFFPIVGLVAWDWQKLKRRHGDLAAIISAHSAKAESISSGALECQGKKEKTLELVGENIQDVITVSKECFLYAKAEANYVEIVTLEDASPDRVRRFLLRIPLKSLETQFMPWSSEILRCHRSYLVNQNRILKAEGNAQGLLLTLPNGQLVPVSRRYVELFRA